jgi:hypothetical protein
VLKFEESQNSRVMRVKIGINTDWLHTLLAVL